jgi:hypothetical protein
MRFYDESLLIYALIISISSKIWEYKSFFVEPFVTFLNVNGTGIKLLPLSLIHVRKLTFDGEVDTGKSLAVELSIITKCKNITKACCFVNCPINSTPFLPKSSSSAK